RQAPGELRARAQGAVRPEPRLRLSRGLHDDAAPPRAGHSAALHADLGARPDLRVVPARGPRQARRRLQGRGRPARRRPHVRRREPITVLVYNQDEAKAYAAPVRARRWREGILPDRLAGKTMTLVGLGDIGRTIAAAARSLGMRVLGVSRSGRAVREVERVHRLPALERALGQADFVVVVVPLTDGTRGLLGARAL